MVLYVGKGSEREQCHFLSSCPASSHFPPYPKANWALLVLITGWVGLYILGPVESLQWTLLWYWQFSVPLKPPQVFTTRGFEALFPCAGTLGWVVCLTPQLFLLVYPYVNVGLPHLRPCQESSLPGLHVSNPPTSLDECFVFNSLVVGPPYSSIFWQFWLFFVLKFIVVLLLVVQGSKAYLPMPPSWPEEEDID